MMQLRHLLRGTRSKRAVVLSVLSVAAFALAKLEEESRHERDFTRGLRAAVRGLWSGVLMYSDFIEAMQPTIRQGVRWAYLEGARECGIRTEDELMRDPEHRYAQQRITYQEYQYLHDFAEDIERNDRAHKGHLAPLLARADLWANRFTDVVNQARMRTCGSRHLEWSLGKTEKHCVDCLALNHIVKTAREWLESGVRPQSKRLACGGWRCDCSLTPTTEPVTDTAIPALIGPSKR